MKKVKSFLLQNKTDGQTIAKNTFWLSFSQLSRKVIKFAVIIYAARVLGVEGYGVFSYAIGLAGFLAIFSDIGTNGLLVRDFSAEGKILQRNLSTFLYIKLVLISISVLLILFVAPIFTNIPEAIPLISIIAILMAFDGLKDFTIAIVRATERMELEAGIDILTNIATLTFSVLALLTLKSSMSLAIAFTIGSGIGLAFSVFLLREHFGYIWKYFDKGLAKKILINAWPFALMGLLGTIMTSTDIVMLGWLKDAKAVGLYSAAIKPVQAIYLISGILAIATLPKISRFTKGDKSRARNILERSISSLFLIGIPLTAGGIMLGEKIITTIYGIEYLNSSLIFQILLITILAVFPMNMIANLILAYNKQKKFISPLAIAAIGNVILNIVMIPIYGIIGAAIATVLTQFFAIAMIWIKMKRINHFSVLPYMGKILLATALMIVATTTMRFMSVNFLINIILSALLYFSFLKILKEPLLGQIRGVASN